MFTVQSKGLRNHENVLGLSCDWSYPHTKHSDVVSLAAVARRVSIYTYKITVESLAQHTNVWFKANAMFW